MDKKQLEFDETKALRPNDRRCKRCNRKLKTAEAIKNKYGSRCFKLMMEQKAFRKEDGDDPS